MVVRARSMFDRRSAADELECQAVSGAPPLVALRRSVRPVAGTFSLILLVAMTRAPDAFAMSAHLLH